MQNTERDKQITEYRLSGYSLQDIANIYGISKCTVSSICKRLGCGGIMSDKQKRIDPKAVVEKWPFEYIGGYYHRDKPVMVRCKTCGSVVEMGFHTFLSAGKGWNKSDSKNPRCPVCYQNKRERKKEEHIAKLNKRLELAEVKAKEKAEAEEAKEREKYIDMHISRTCKNCGKTFCKAETKYDSVIYCSHECAKKFLYRSGKDKRIERMKNIIVDDDITLEKLYERDNGMCYLCGCKCEWDDAQWKGTAFCIGKHYPTIDHIMPITKGGEHSWNNIRLACLSCNAKKGNR